MNTIASGAALVALILGGFGTAAHGAPATHRTRAQASATALGPHAQADPDTSLDDFLDEMADSTDLYFGKSAAARDTAGLDSALAYALDHPENQPHERALHFGVMPSLAFNRVDGPVWGGALSVGDARRLGQLRGELQYAVGPNEWLGGGSYRTAVRRGETWWTGLVSGGRSSHAMDRDHAVGHLASLRALLTGSDRKHYYRRDGWAVHLERETATSRVGLGYRNMLEKPLATTTTWNLLRREPKLVLNLPAERGRVREIQLETGLRLPFTPVTVQLDHDVADGAIGSDFEYGRTRVAASSEIGIGDLATLVPQVAYGRQTGDAIPQAAFYLGGAHSMRSLESASRGGTGLALARLDLLGASDILRLAHIPHPAAFPIQAGLFVASGAVWGADPYGGPARPGKDGPRSEDWIHEAGVSLVYQPGIPDPTTLIRFNYMWPLGPGRESRRWSISISRALDLVKPIGEEE